MATDKKSITKHHYICFVAGKSGGHILPCITLAQQAVNKHPDYEVLFFSTDSTLDKQLLSGNPIIKNHIQLKLGSLPYGKLFSYPFFFINLILSFFKSLYHLNKSKPETVISTGGLVSIPVCFAAKLLGIPIELYELNVVPGKTIKLLAPLSHKVWICFEQSFNYLPAQKCALTSYPIKFIDKTKIMAKDEAVSGLNFSTMRKTILVLGGSQGSIFINNAMRHFVEHNSHLYATIQVIHQTGALDSTDWHKFYENKNIPALVFSYSDKIGQYYAAADLVICRSGAGTLAEIIFFDKQCITIPLETKTTMHQIDNANAAAHKCPDLITVLTQTDVELNYEHLSNAIIKRLHSVQ
jgi:UDP-N-acetylglucosamine--N-acetylmuramyl-(pentapeptide) pyrophosphoryl-undecaprenol N-acetylglucosamine transferase